MVDKVFLNISANYQKKIFFSNTTNSLINTLYMYINMFIDQ